MRGNFDPSGDIENLRKAIKILDEANRAACSEPLPVWLKIKHAKQSLEKQLTELMDDPEVLTSSR